MNQNKSKGLSIGLSIGLVCLTKEASNIVCTLCDKQTKFSKIFNFISHISREHGSDIDYTGKIKSEVIDADLLKKCKDNGNSFEIDRSKDYIQGMDSTSLKKNLQELVDGTNMNTVKNEKDTFNMVDITSKEFYCHHCKRHFLSGKEVVDHICNSISSTFAETVRVRNQTIHKDERNYNCEICNKSFPTLRGFRTHNTRIHQKTHQDANKFFGDNCDENFSLENELLNHKCLNDASSSKDLIKRKDGTTVIKSNNEFCCTFCSVKLKTSSSLTDHMKTHNSNKALNCPHCPATLKSREALNYHLRRHNSRKSFKCDYCNYSFYTSSNLKAHLKKSHTTSFGKERNFKCEICKEIFSTLKGFRTHKTRVHRKIFQDEKKFHCRNCNKNISSESEMVTHICSKDPTSSVEVIEKKCGTSVIENTKAYCCTICSAKFKTTLTLKKHMVTHNARPPFKCEQCSRGFYNSYILKRHMVTHSGERPFKCEQCSSTFKRFDLLKTHIVIHSGKKPYKCEQCPRAYYHLPNLKKHILIHTRKSNNARKRREEAKNHNREGERLE